jgi:hypothetical protein
MARIVAEKSESSFSQVIHSAGVPRFGEAQRSAPRDCTMSTFFVPQTPVTSAPNHLAICTANVPTPPPHTVNQHLLSWLNPPLIAKTLQGGERSHWHRSGFLERQLFRLADQGWAIDIGRQ